MKIKTKDKKDIEKLCIAIDKDIIENLSILKDVYSLSRTNLINQILRQGIDLINKKRRKK